MILQGKAAWVFPDSFDVDYIIGIPNIGLTDLKQITACLMKDFDPEFLDSCAPGDMLIAGKSFGYGHAHPQPMAGSAASLRNPICSRSSAANWPPA